MGARSIVFVLCVVLSCDASAHTAAGTVFEDLNHDGQRTLNEPGLANVRVSNGTDVVLTDQQGRSKLDVGDEGIIFITKPSGYAPPVNIDRLPRFFYLHQPKGSPTTLRFPGIAPTGELPASIDFPLQRQEEPTRFHALLFSDTQPQSEAEVDFVRDTAVAETIGTDAAFGMTLGDIMFDDLSLYPRLNRVIAQIGVPWYNVPGNHEIDYSSPNDRYSLETFKKWFGPTYYSFEYANVEFVVLKDIAYQGPSESAEYPAGLRAGGKFIGRIEPEELTWLANELKHVPDDKLVVLTMHSPLKTNTGAPERPEANVAYRKDLFRVLNGRSHVYVLAGHTHMMEHVYFGAADGWQGKAELHEQMLAAVCGSWWSGPIDAAGVPVSDLRDGAPRGYHVLDVDGTNVRVRFKAVGHPADYQMRILFDVRHNATRPDIYRDFRPGELGGSRFSVDEVPSAAVVVNLFDGGPKSTVAYSIDGDAPVPMHRISAPDPYLVEEWSRARDTIKSFVKPIPSTHLYVAELPDPSRRVLTPCASTRSTSSAPSTPHRE
jgi:hypothetical protein